MNFLDKTLYFAARGIYLYPNFLATVPQLAMVTKTLDLFRRMYPTKEEEEDQKELELRPYFYENAGEKFSCMTWEAKDHKHVSFKGNKNIPFYVQDLFLPHLFSLLAPPHNPNMKQRRNRLERSLWHLDISLNYTNKENKTEPNLQDFTCGSFKAGQTALLVYNVGAPALLRLSKEYVAGSTMTLLVPHDSLLVFTKKAFEPGQQYLLPIFRDYVTQNEEFLEGELRRAMFSFKYTLPIPIRDPGTPGKPPALA